MFIFVKKILSMKTPVEIQEYISLLKNDLDAINSDIKALDVGVKELLDKIQDLDGLKESTEKEIKILQWVLDEASNGAKTGENPSKLDGQDVKLFMEVDLGSDTVTWAEVSEKTDVNKGFSTSVSIPSEMSADAHSNFALSEEMISIKKENKKRK